MQWSSRFPPRLTMTEAGPGTPHSAWMRKRQWVATAWRGQLSVRGEVVQLKRVATSGRWDGSLIGSSMELRLCPLSMPADARTGKSRVASMGSGDRAGSGTWGDCPRTRHRWTQEVPQDMLTAVPQRGHHVEKKKRTARAGKPGVSGHGKVAGQVAPAYRRSARKEGMRVTAKMILSLCRRLAQ